MSELSGQFHFLTSRFTMVWENVDIDTRWHESWSLKEQVLKQRSVEQEESLWPGRLIRQTSWSVHDEYSVKTDGSARLTIRRIKTQFRCGESVQKSQRLLKPATDEAHHVDEGLSPLMTASPTGSPTRFKPWGAPVRRPVTAKEWDSQEDAEDTRGLRKHDDQKGNSISAVERRITSYNSRGLREGFLPYATRKTRSGKKLGCQNN